MIKEKKREGNEGLVVSNSKRVYAKKQLGKVLRFL